MNCGYTLLKELNETPSIYSDLEKNSAYFEVELRKVFDKYNLKYALNRVGSMVSFHFDVDVVENFEHACNANADLFKKLFHGVLEKGVYFAPSAFESLFLSHTHSKELLDKTINAMDKTFEEIL
jgi:glutamate-1-semialdehyde 2,1-aminomutase